jgi:hypothetical protein
MGFGFKAAPFLVSLVSFAFFVWQGKELTISKAFTVGFVLDHSVFYELTLNCRLWHYTNQ